MAGIDSLPEGYEYCNCHPETCNHKDGVRKIRKECHAFFRRECVNKDIECHRCNEYY